MAAKSPLHWTFTRSLLAACCRNALALSEDPCELDPRVLEREGPWVPFVPLDGPPDPAVVAAAWARLPKRWTGGFAEEELRGGTRPKSTATSAAASGLPLAELVHLASLVDPQKKVSLPRPLQLRCLCSPYPLRPLSAGWRPAYPSS